MADCSYARCMQERRIIKKRLQTWTKNCIYTLGFERVAEEFMGGRQWKVYQEKVLKSSCPSIEKDILVKDWDPTDDKCNFCDLDTFDTNTTPSDEEAKSPVTSDSQNYNNNNIDLLGSDSSDSSEGLPGMTVSSMAAMAALAGPHGLPYYPSAGFPRWYLSPPPPARNLLDTIAKAEPPMVMSIPPTAATEMPLDLSAKSSKTPPAESPDNIRVPSIIESKPSIFGTSRPPRMSPMSGRKSYTEDELQSALRDIQSGKLGTRRAAVIYGIPRSTLRNKVYKLALERERDAHVMLGTPLPRPSPPEPASSILQSEREESSLEEDKESSSQPGLSMEELLRLSGVDRSPQSSVLASYLAQLLKLKENVSPGEEDSMLMKRVMEERKNGVEEDQSNVILRIPSFKPNTEPTEKAQVNGDPPLTPEAGANLRDVIAKTISHKFQGEPPKMVAFPQMQQQSPSHQSQHQRPCAQGKGTRPKRGKYRNYDRDSLVEAVRAVQRGEMSVHRAGSYYGVPHSTLEYKVKERHLMRPRKREPKPEDKLKPPSTSSTPLQLDKSKTPMAPKPMAKSPFPQPNGLKLPPSLFDTGVPPLAPYGGAPFPFWPPHPFHGLPLPPDQMFGPTIPHTTRRIAESLYDGSGHNGSFLDGIIRSSLELGLKNASDKAGHQPSSKSLIDQLCLSSRGPTLHTAPPMPSTPTRSGETHSDDERTVRYDMTTDDESEDRIKREYDHDVPVGDENEDIDDISNHASEDDEPEAS